MGTHSGENFTYSHGVVEQRVPTARSRGEWSGEAQLTALRRFTVKQVAPKIRERRPPTLEVPDAHVRWGRTSSFTEQEFEAIRRNWGYNYNAKDIDLDRPRLTCPTACSYRTFTIVNVDNPECYARVQVAASATIDIPTYSVWAGKLGHLKKHVMEGGQAHFHMDPTPPDVDDDGRAHEGSGQTPEAPPELSEIE